MGQADPRRLGEAVGRHRPLFEELDQPEPEHGPEATPPLPVCYHIHQYYSQRLYMNQSEHEAMHGPVRDLRRRGGAGLAGGAGARDEHDVR
jgi:hypothetical protein